MTRLTLTEQDCGSAFHLQVGDELSISLEAIPGTGYSWEVLDEDRLVLNQVGEAIIEKSDTQMLGGVERQVFHFRVNASGNRRLKLEYRRPWDKPGIAAKSFYITLISEK